MHYSAVAYSLALGELQLYSYRGEPLNIEIPVVEPSSWELLDLNITQIRGNNAVKLGYPSSAFDRIYGLELLSDGSGKMWLSVSSNLPVDYENIQFSLELVTPSFDVDRRQYTLKLPERPTFESNITVEDAQYYIVQSGDLLGRIAQKVRPDEMIKLQSIIQFLHLNNKKSFVNGDINNIVVGAKLRLPNENQYSLMPRR